MKCVRSRGTLSEWRMASVGVWQTSLSAGNKWGGHSCLPGTKWGGHSCLPKLSFPSLRRSASPANRGGAQSIQAGGAKTAAPRSGCHGAAATLTKVKRIAQVAKGGIGNEQWAATLTRGPERIAPRLNSPNRGALLRHILNRRSYLIWASLTREITSNSAACLP